MDDKTIIAIAVSMASAIGLMLLGLVSWGLQALIKAVIKSTHQNAILSLEVGQLKEEMRAYRESMSDIDKIRKDLNEAHHKIREMRGNA